MFPDASTFDGTLDACLENFQRLANSHERVRRILSLWDRILIIEVLDDGRRYYMKTADGAVTFISTLPQETTKVVHVRAKERVLREIFTGRRNAARAFFDAEMEVFADERDQVKLEAITMILWSRS